MRRLLSKLPDWIYYQTSGRYWPVHDVWFKTFAVEVISYPHLSVRWGEWIYYFNLFQPSEWFKPHARDKVANEMKERVSLTLAEYS